MKAKFMTWGYANSDKLYRWSILLWAISIIMAPGVSVFEDGIADATTALLGVCGAVLFLTVLFQILFQKSDDKPDTINEEPVVDDKYAYKCEEYSNTLNDLLEEYQSLGYKDYDYMAECVNAFNELIAVKAPILSIESVYSRLYKLLTWSGLELVETLCVLQSKIANDTKIAGGPIDDIPSPSTLLPERNGETVGKIKGKKPNFAQKKALQYYCDTELEASQYLYQKDVTKQADGSKNLNSNIEKITYWQFVHRETGELKSIPVER